MNQEVKIINGYLIKDETARNNIETINGNIETINDNINSIDKKIYIVDLETDDLQDVIDKVNSGSLIICKGTDTSDTLYEINKDLTIKGGKFILTPRECTSGDYGVKPLFRITNSDVTIDNITLEAESYNENPFIYVREGAEITNQTDSNIEMVTCSNSKVTIENSTIKNCIGCYGSNSNIKLINNNFIGSMFVFGSTNVVESKGNIIEVQESNLINYYHVYYLDTNSDLKVSNDNVKSNSLFFDVIHTGLSQENQGLNCEIHNSSIVGKFKRLNQGNELDLKLYNCNLYLNDLEVFYFTNNLTNTNISFNGYINENVKPSKLAWNEGKGIGSNGNLYNDDTRQATDLTDIDFKYFIILENNDTMIAFYDSEGTFISRTTSIYFTEVPSNAKKYRLSRPNDSNFRFIVW